MNHFNAQFWEHEEPEAVKTGRVKLKGMRRDRHH